jgi:hypothetical protein
MLIHSAQARAPHLLERYAAEERWIVFYQPIRVHGQLCDEAFRESRSGQCLEPVSSAARVAVEASIPLANGHNI